MVANVTAVWQRLHAFVGAPPLTPRDRAVLATIMGRKHQVRAILLLFFFFFSSSSFFGGVSLGTGPPCFFLFSPFFSSCSLPAQTRPTRHLQS